MYKIRVTYKIPNKKPFEGHFTRSALAITVDKILLAFPNDEIDTIKITSAVVDVFDDKKEA